MPVSPFPSAITWHDPDLKGRGYVGKWQPTCGQQGISPTCNNFGLLISALDRLKWQNQPLGLNRDHGGELFTGLLPGLKMKMRFISNKDISGEVYKPGWSSNNLIHKGSFREKNSCRWDNSFCFWGNRRCKLNMKSLSWLFELQSHSQFENSEDLLICNFLTHGASW